MKYFNKIFPEMGDDMNASRGLIVGIVLCLVLYGAIWGGISLL